MEAESAIELNGLLELADVTRFQYFHTFRRSWLIALAVVLFGLILCVTTTVSPDFSGTFLQTLPFLLLLLLWLVLLIVMPYRNARKAFVSQRYFREPVSFTFTPQKISNSGAGISATLEWSILKHIRETRNYFFLYQTENVAYIVPKRFFRSPDEMEAWRRLTAASVAAKVIESPGVVGRRC